VSGLGGWMRRNWALDWVRAPALLVYYLLLIYVLVRLYGAANPPPTVPFVYQGF